MADENMPVKVASITITGGTVTAKGGDQGKDRQSAAGIGGGAKTPGGKITISGGKFTSKVDDQYLEEGLTQGQDGTVGAQDDVSVAELWSNGERSDFGRSVEERAK